MQAVACNLLGILLKVVDEVEECLVSGCGLTDHIPCDNCGNCFQGSSRSGNCSIVLCCVSIIRIPAEASQTVLMEPCGIAE